MTILPLLKPVSVRRRPKGLQRGGPIRSSNPERKDAMHARNFSGGTGLGHDEFIRGLPCLVYGCNRFTIEAAHTVTRKAGGCGSSWRQLVPLCRKHHTGSQGQEGRTEEFGKEHGINLHALAEVLVVADPRVPNVEKLEAWRRLEAYQDFERMGALHRGYDLCGYVVEPPRVAEEVKCE